MKGGGNTTIINTIQDESLEFKDKLYLFLYITISLGIINSCFQISTQLCFDCFILILIGRYYSKDSRLTVKITFQFKILSILIEIIRQIVILNFYLDDTTGQLNLLWDSLVLFRFINYITSPVQIILDFLFCYMIHSKYIEVFCKKSFGLNNNSGLFKLEEVNYDYL